MLYNYKMIRLSIDGVKDEEYSSSRWYKDGYLHRDYDLPAIKENYSHSFDFYRNGVYIRHEWLKPVNPC